MPAVPPEEYQIYGIVLEDVHKQGTKEGWFLIEALTTSFRCDSESATGFAIGGCGGGMRSSDLKPNDVLENVHGKLSVTDSTLRNFELKTRRGYNLDAKFPVNFRYVVWGPVQGGEIPKGWGNPDFAVYLSRVGFNPEKTEALVYVARASWIDAALSGSEYILIQRDQKGWKIRRRMKFMGLEAPGPPIT